MKPERRIDLTTSAPAHPDQPKASLLVIVPDEAERPDGDSLHILSRGEACELLRAWRRDGRPFRDRYRLPIMAALNWWQIELLRAWLGESSTDADEA